LTAAEISDYIDGITRADPVAGLLQRLRQGVLDDPLRFALLFGAFVVAVYVPGGIALSLADSDLKIPIWLDYMWPVFFIAWMTLAWAYARQPRLVADSLACGGELLGDSAAVRRWVRIVSTRWIPLVFGAVVLTGIVVTVTHVLPDPAFYHDFYWRKPVYFEVVFTPLIALLFYLGLLVSCRQSVAGFVLGAALLRFRPPQPLSYEAAMVLVRQIQLLGGSLTRQAAPWVIVGVWLLIWLIAALFQDTYSNVVLYWTAIAYVPGLICSLLFPLFALSIALLRIRRVQIQKIETQLEGEYARALGMLTDMHDIHQMGEQGSRIRDLQEMRRLTNAYFPSVPLMGARLQVVAAGAVLQTFAFWLGLVLDATSVAKLFS
jgi:hypothetical protein